MNRFSILLVVFLLATSCQQSFMGRSTTIITPEKNVSSSVTAPADFLKAITELEKRTMGNDKNLPDIWLRLSLLYSHHKNPFPDHYKALNSLEQYLKLSKRLKQPDYVYDRLALLKQIVLFQSERSANQSNRDIIELMRQDNRNLMIENQKLKEENETITNENLAMRQMLERLGQIELQHEKKRKQIK